MKAANGERTTAKERKLAAALADPVAWGESYLKNRDGSPRRYWPHQKDDLACSSPNIIHLDGRDVGKSIVLTTDALHYAFTNRGGQGLIAAPHQGHLDTVIEEIEFQIDANPDIEWSIAVTKYGKPKIIRKPYFRIEFTNGSVLFYSVPLELTATKTPPLARSLRRRNPRNPHVHKVRSGFCGSSSLISNQIRHFGAGLGRCGVRRKKKLRILGATSRRTGNPHRTRDS